MVAVASYATRTIFVLWCVMAPVVLRRLSRFEEDPDAAVDRHYAAHPEDRGANIVIFDIYDDQGTADEGQECGPPAGPTV